MNKAFEPLFGFLEYLLVAIAGHDPGELQLSSGVVGIPVQDPTVCPDGVLGIIHLLRAEEAKSVLALLDLAPVEQRNLPEERVERNWALVGVGDRVAARTSIQQLLASYRLADALEQDGFLKMSSRDFARSAPRRGRDSGSKPGGSAGRASHGRQP